MSYRLLLFLVSIIFLSSHSLVLANLQMSEIMYDLKTGSDSGREWVEIYNDGENSIDLSSFRFFEADTDHKLKLIQGNENIPSKGYAIIVSDFDKFRIDWPSFSGIAFDSSFSLSNDGEVLMLKDKDLNIVDQYTYKSNLGGFGDGTSIQKINGIWVQSTPTPGLENKIYIKPIPVASPLKSEPLSKNITNQKKSLNENQNIEISDQQNIITHQLADSYMADGVAEDNFSHLPMIIAGFLIFISAGFVYFIRRRRNPSSNYKIGEDFEILDE